MINFDSFIKDEYKLKYENTNPLTVQHPARCCIVGASGCGKTNLLLNLLLNKTLKMDYTRIYLIVKDATEDKYRFLRDYFKDIEDNLGRGGSGRTSRTVHVDRRPAERARPR